MDLIRRGASTVRNDELRVLFVELRRLKTEELPRAERMAPVERAYQEERIREAIRRVEEEIERGLSDARNY